MRHFLVDDDLSGAVAPGEEADADEFVVRALERAQSVARTHGFDRSVLAELLVDHHAHERAVTILTAELARRLDLGDVPVVKGAAAALTRPQVVRRPADHVEALRAAGLDDLAVLDVVNSSAFFNWANRLMLTLGEPDVPKRYR